MKVFAVTIACLAHALGCKISDIWGGPVIITHYEAKDVETCEVEVREYMKWYGYNPADIVVRCDSRYL